MPEDAVQGRGLAGPGPFRAPSVWNVAQPALARSFQPRHLRREPPCLQDGRGVAAQWAVARSPGDAEEDRGPREGLPSAEVRAPASAASRVCGLWRKCIDEHAQGAALVFF